MPEDKSKKSVRITSSNYLGFSEELKLNEDKYLVQTDDHGPKTHQIITHIYKKGQIVSTSKTDYKEVLDIPEYERIVKDMIEKQHELAVEALKEAVNKEPRQHGGAARSETEGTDDDDEDEPAGDLRQNAYEKIRIKVEGNYDPGEDGVSLSVDDLLDDKTSVLKALKADKAELEPETKGPVAGKSEQTKPATPSKPSPKPAAALNADNQPHAAKPVKEPVKEDKPASDALSSEEEEFMAAMNSTDSFFDMSLEPETPLGVDSTDTQSTHSVAATDNIGWDEKSDTDDPFGFTSGEDEFLDASLMPEEPISQTELSETTIDSAQAQEESTHAAEGQGEGDKAVEPEEPPEVEQERKVFSPEEVHKELSTGQSDDASSAWGGSDRGSAPSSKQKPVNLWEDQAGESGAEPEKKPVPGTPPAQTRGKKDSPPKEIPKASEPAYEVEKPEMVQPGQAPSEASVDERPGKARNPWDEEPAPPEGVFGSDPLDKLSKGHEGETYKPSRKSNDTGFVNLSHIGMSDATLKALEAFKIKKNSDDDEDSRQKNQEDDSEPEPEAQRNELPETTDKSENDFVDIVERQVNSKRKEQALGWAERGLHYYPEQPVLLSYRGWLIASLFGRHDEGIRMCNDAVRLLKENYPMGSEFFYPVLHLNRGRVFLVAGRKEEALEAFKMGLRINRDDTSIKEEMKKLSPRGEPPIAGLDRGHSLNKYIGKFRKKYGK